MNPVFKVFRSLISQQRKYVALGIIWVSRAHTTDCFMCSTNSNLLTLHFTPVGSALCEHGQPALGLFKAMDVETPNTGCAVPSSLALASHPVSFFLVFASVASR